MDSTRQHLLRVSDIVGEIEGRLRSLRLQAQKAERYKRYKAELRDLDLWSSAQRYLGHLAEEKSAIAELGEVRERHETRARPRWRSKRRRSRPSGWRCAEEAQRAGDGQGRSVRAVEQGAARHAAGRAPRVEAAELTVARRGRRARRPRSCGRGPSRAAPTSRRSRRQLSRDRRRRRAARARVRSRKRACRTSGARPWPRRAARSTGRCGEMAAASARLARLEAERTAAMQRREDLAARLAGLAGEEAAADERLSALTAEETRIAGAGAGAARAGRGGAPRGPPRKRPSSRRCAPSSAAASWSWRPCARRRTGGARGWRRCRRSRSATRASRRAFAPSCRSTSRGRAAAHGHRRGGRRHRAAAAGAGDRRRGGAGRAAGNVIVESHEAGVEAIQFLKQKSEGRRRSSRSRCAAAAGRGPLRRHGRVRVSAWARRVGGRRRSAARSIRPRSPDVWPRGARRARADARPHRLRPASTTRSRPTCSATCWWSRISSGRWRSGARRARPRPSSRSRARSSIRTASSPAARASRRWPACSSRSARSASWRR